MHAVYNISLYFEYTTDILRLLPYRTRLLISAAPVLSSGVIDFLKILILVVGL